MKTAVPAPLFRIDVTTFAWTHKQAARVKQQVEHMFAGAEVTISDNVADLPEVVAPPVALTAPETAAAPLAEIPTAPVIQAPEPIAAPVKLDQKLRDLHTGAIVQVTEINGVQFIWQNIDADCAENARTGICPFAAFANCYEIIPETVEAAAEIPADQPAAASVEDDSSKKNE